VASNKTVVLQFPTLSQANKANLLWLGQVMRPLSIHYDGPDDGEFYEIDPVTNEKSAVLMLRANRDYKVFFQEGHSYCVSSSPESTFSLKLGEGATEAFVHCKIGENQSIIGFDGVGIKVEVDSAAASATTPAAPPPAGRQPSGGCDRPGHSVCRRVHRQRRPRRSDQKKCRHEWLEIEGWAEGRSKRTSSPVVGTRPDVA